MFNLCESVTRHAALTPARIALRADSSSLTYAELDRAAGHLADRLAALGVAPGQCVALCYERSFDQIIAALAILRAGAAYVPLDPAWPVERIGHIVADCGARVFIAPKALSEQVSAPAVSLSLEDDGANGAASVPVEAGVAERAAISPESLAYILYTSGSTGAPKGVEITHGNLAHLIAWHCAAFAVTADDNASHLAGLGFDASVWEVWPYLASGACVSLAGDAVRTSPDLLQQWLVESRITMAFVPTPLAEPMIAVRWPEETALRFLLTGGDALHVAPRAGLPFPVINNYGPTECTVVATSGLVPPAQGPRTGPVPPPTIGRAIAGTAVYILDEQGEAAAEGEIGELVIGGGGVGRGYRNLPELTARSFVPDRFSPGPGGMLFKTGDRASALASGEIAFHGRVDAQVKIRGQRIELGEVISALNRHPGVSFCTVVAAGDGNDRHLVGYVLPKEGTPPSARELREFVAHSLTGAMVPARFVLLTHIPMNANGKVDPRLLPLPSPSNSLPEKASRPPASAVEDTVLAIVRRLLKTGEVGMEDDFFLIGGHSLMGTQLVMRVREAFGVSLTLRDLFETGTVAELAALVEAMLIAELESMSEEDAAKQLREQVTG